jgi:PAS domain-containing protein
VQAELIKLEPFWRRLTARVEHLARRRQRYAELFEFAPAACLVTDRGGVIREVNQAAAYLLERNGGLLAGKPLVALVAAGRQREFLRHLHERKASWQSALRMPAGALEVTLAVRRAPGGLCWTIRRQP